MASVQAVPDGKRCGVCGATVPRREAQYNHMRVHPIPDEAQPAEICNHPAVSLNVWWDGDITLGDLPEGVYKKTYDNLPAELREIIEIEHGAGRNDIGWYFPKTRQSANGVDIIYHLKWRQEFL